MKIANKISLSFFAVTAICTAAALAFLYFIAESNLHRSIEAHLTSIAESRKTHIETYLQMLKTSVGQLSKSPTLDDLLIITDKDNLQQSKEFEVAMTRLRRTKEANPSIYEFLLLDKTGKAIASSNEKNIGTDKSTDAYFLGGQKVVFIKDVYYLEAINEPLIAVSAPFLDAKTGELLGVLVARVKLNDLWNITTERTGLGETGEIILVNKHKIMITPSLYFKDTVLKQKADTEGARQSFLHQDTELIPTIFADYRGVPALEAHGYIPEMQWVVIAKIDAKEAFAPLARLRLLLPVILFFTILIAWLLSWRIARLIAGPIKKLHEGTAIIGSGNLDYKVGIDTKDEIGQLSRAFDTMTKDLKATTTSVEKLNKEITVRKLTEEKLRERTAAMFEREEDLAITLRSIGDALIATDTKGKITRMNPAAEHLTGWSQSEAAAKPLEDVFRIINAQTREPVLNPIAQVLSTGQNVGLANHTALIARDGTERQIADSAAPIRDMDGRIRGVVLVFHDVTDAYRAKDAARKREAKIFEAAEEWSRTFNSITDLIFIQDNDFNITKVNKAFADAMKAKPEDLIGKKCYELLHKRNSPWPDCPFEKVKKDKLSHTEEVDDPNIGIPLLVNSSPILNDRGELIGSVHLAKDITERKKFEEALKKNAALLKETGETARVGGWEIKVDNMTLTWTEEVYLIHEVDKNSFRPTVENGINFYTPASRPIIERAVQRAIKYGEPFELELELITAKGNKLWVHAIGKAEQKDGRTVAVSGTFQDITERKKAQDELLFDNLLLSTQQEVSLDGILVVDSDGNIISFNRRFVELWEIPPEVIASKSDERVMQVAISQLNNPDKFTERVRYLYEHRQETSRDEIILKDGRTFDRYSAPLIGNNENYYGRIWFFRDITERKQAEQNLGQAKTDLEKAYQQLQEAFELESRLTVQSQAASAAKSQFVANISHEIRTPLNGIIGICELLLETKMSNEQIEYAQTINSSANALLNIINSTLDFSKIAAGKMEFEHIDFNLRNILEDIISVLAANAAKKKLELVDFIEPNVPLNLNGDHGRLHQVLCNLIGNAIKFTHEGEINVTVALVEEKENRAILRFSVRDTGIGIPADKTNLLFNAFSQVDASMARKFGGTGLGLSISKGLVEQMGGSIGVESVHGKGSIFWFIIPFLKQGADAPTSELPTDSGKFFEEKYGRAFLKHEQYQPGKRLRILVAEDNMANQMVILGILEKLGHSAGAVADGKEVVKLLETIPYDLVLMDVQMPEMDGLEATAVIRDPKSPVRDHNIPILALTAHTMPEDREKCLSAGMNGYITKPVSIKSIADALANIISPGKNPVNHVRNLSEQLHPGNAITSHDEIQLENRRKGLRPLRPEDGPALRSPIGEEGNLAGAESPFGDPSSGSLAVFDSKALADRLSGDGALIREIINIFLEETPKSMRELEKAVEKQQQENASRLAHTIKGSAANVSGNKLNAVALRIEKLCDSADWREAKALVPKLSRQFEMLEKAMREYLKKAEGA